MGSNSAGLWSIQAAGYTTWDWPCYPSLSPKLTYFHSSNGNPGSVPGLRKYHWEEWDKLSINEWAGRMAKQLKCGTFAWCHWFDIFPPITVTINEHVGEHAYTEAWWWHVYQVMLHKPPFPPPSGLCYFLCWQNWRFVLSVHLSPPALAAPPAPSSPCGHWLFCNSVKEPLHFQKPWPWASRAGSWPHCSFNPFELFIYAVYWQIYSEPWGLNAFSWDKSAIILH